MMHLFSLRGAPLRAATLVSLLAACVDSADDAAVNATHDDTASGESARHRRGRAKNVILFIGDGMGTSTITATRVLSVGIDGELVIDQLPYSALSRTADADHITPDSASTMTSMMTGVNTNSGVIGLGPTTEFGDFNGDGDGERLTTLLELAKQRGMRAGVVSTARVTHATPAACYAHINNRDNEAAIALQALPTDATYNSALAGGLDLIMGGGRQFFVPKAVVDEEGGAGARTDGRDLRAEYQAAGYHYVWNAQQFASLGHRDLPVLGLFDRGHMEYEIDRPTDLGGEPSLSEMTAKSVDIFERATRFRRQGYFLMVEAGRIDHAHHAGNAYRALTDTEELDRAVWEAIRRVDLSNTLILVTADHSHVFTMAGYPLRQAAELPYPVASAPPEYLASPHNNLFDVVYDVNDSGEVVKSLDAKGVPYTVLGYHNGPGYRGAPRVDPAADPFAGSTGKPGAGPNHPDYRQEAAVPLGSETHAGEDVALFAVGAGASLVRGTVKNSFVFDVMASVLGL
jgi:alkaline phosphatase